MLHYVLVSMDGSLRAQDSDRSVCLLQLPDADVRPHSLSLPDCLMWLPVSDWDMIVRISWRFRFRTFTISPSITPSPTWTYWGSGTSFVYPLTLIRMRRRQLSTGEFQNWSGILMQIQTWRVSQFFNVNCVVSTPLSFIGSYDAKLISGASPNTQVTLIIGRYAFDKNPFIGIMADINVWDRSVEATRR